MSYIGRAVVRVGDLDQAHDFYRRAFGFDTLYDEELFEGFRALHIGPGAVADPGIWLFPASPVVTDGEPVLVLYTEDLDGDVSRLRGVGVEPVTDIDGHPGARHISVRDPWGNVVVIAEPRSV